MSEDQTKKILQADKALMSTYGRFPIIFKNGKGARIWDADGKEYIDFFAGLAVNNLGHSHPRVVKALTDQAEKLFHVTNLFYNQPMIDLASKLVDVSFADQVFFCNSGAEANEGAIKLAKKFSFDKGDKKRNKIITMENSFHGRTAAGMAATGQDKIKTGFAPILDGFEHIPFNDIDALKAKMDNTVTAVLLEPVQGEGGVTPADKDYLVEVRKLCDAAGSLLIFDEVQTGIGRCGALFAYETFGVEPDVMTLAKALGNGLPIGAILAKGDAAKALTPGSHGSTFGGTAIVSAPALAVLDVMIEEKIPEKCAETGKYFIEKLNLLKEKKDTIKQVRGLGLLIGLEIEGKAADVVKQCLDRGFVINAVQENVLRFVPPLTIEKSDIDLLIDCLEDLL